MEVPLGQFNLGDLDSEIVVEVHYTPPPVAEVAVFVLKDVSENLQN